MKQSPKFMIRNTRSTSHTRGQNYQQTPLTSYFQTNPLLNETKSNLEERVSKLEGNLKLLEKKYKDNLKVGFDNKIKAYRLQAVVERKLLKEAVQQTEKDRQLQQLQEKIQHNEALRKLSQERALVSHIQQQQRKTFIKRRNTQQKRNMSMTMYVRNKEEKEKTKEIHDKILWEDQHLDRKKNFFNHLKKEQQQKELIQTKKTLLTRVINNTHKLKELKALLDNIEEPDSDHLFLTL